MQKLCTADVLYWKYADTQDTMMIIIGVTRNVQRVIQTKVVSSRFSVNDAALRDHDEDFDQKSLQNISQKTKQEKHTKHNTR